VFTLAEYATGKPEEIADAFGQPMPVYEQTLRQLDHDVPAALQKAPGRWLGTATI
jgi:protein-tyrosine phosphatase